MFGCGTHINQSNRQEAQGYNNRKNFYAHRKTRIKNSSYLIQLYTDSKKRIKKEIVPWSIEYFFAQSIYQANE